MGVGRDLVGSRRFGAVAALVTCGALALLLLTPGGALAAKKKLQVKVASGSQTEVVSDGALRISYKAKGIKKLTASATATPDGGSQIDFAGPASKNKPKQGTLVLSLTDEGQAALEDCASLQVKVKGSGSGKKANASAVLAEDDAACAQPVKEFNLETSIAYPLGIDVGPDGNLWIGAPGADAISKLTTDGVVSDIHIPVPDDAQPGASGGHAVEDVAAGGDGAIWASPFSTAHVRRIDPATGNVTTFPLNSGPSGGGSHIAADPSDGSLWIASGSSELQRVETDGTVTSFPLTDTSSDPTNIAAYSVAVGGDGAVWFTTPAKTQSGFGFSRASIGRLDPGSGETTLFPLQNPDDGLGSMTVDAAGRLWFTNATGNSIGRIDPEAPTPQIVEFKIPTELAKPIGIAFASDGSLWFTESAADNIGRYDPGSGEFTEYPLTRFGSTPFDIVQGPDGMIYFTETGTGKVGRIDPNKAPVGNPNPSDGTTQGPFGDAGRCDDPVILLCQQQVSRGGTFQINTSLTQTLPPEALTLTAGVQSIPGPLVPPVFGPMLESKVLPVEVGGTPANVQISLGGTPELAGLTETIVPIDLNISQPGNPQGGCLIGPIVQDLVNVNDDEGDFGSILLADGNLEGSNSDILGLWTGTLSDETFAIPEAAGCGALTDIVNNLLQLPSPSGENATVLPFSRFIIAGPGL